MLYEFENLALSTNPDKKIETEISDIIEVLEECKKALLRVFNNIKINEIEKFIDEIESMSEVRKRFYKTIIQRRYDILKEAYISLQ